MSVSTESPTLIGVTKDTPTHPSGASSIMVRGEGVLLGKRFTANGQCCMLKIGGYRDVGYQTVIVITITALLHTAVAP